MRGLLLFAFCVLFGTLLPAQPSSPFFATLDAERGNVLAPARNGQVWVGCMKDEQVLLTLLSPAGKLLQKHLINFVGTGLDTESLIDLFEEADGSLVGCGNFENDNEGRGFVFRYNPATRSMLWAHIVRSGGLNFLNGITALGTGGDYVLYGNPHFAGGDDAELVRLRRSTGEVVPGSARRLHLGTSDQINQLVYHEGWLYACGRFTDGD
ncbi:MAG TPA: hypothetical protein PK971_04455, partial [Saprospiraceae bacterium]|nr:hypothetical protein [Saprospiraceae bacterium]